MADSVRLAFLSYYFPPIGGGGSPRSVKFVKYLNEHGYHPVVITSNPDKSTYSREFQPDNSQIEELESTCFDLIRVQNPARSGMQSAIWQSRWFPWIWAGAYPWFYEDVCPWSSAACSKLTSDTECGLPSLIYVSAGPNSTLVAAARAARKLRLPWVADLRDLWTIDSLRTFPSYLHYLWLSRLERQTLRSAAAVIANTPIAGKRLAAWLGADYAGRIRLIPNGFDPDEFGEDKPKKNKPGKNQIVVVHAGTLYEPGFAASRLGRYRPFDLDNSARSAKPIVDGLRELYVLSPEIAARFHVRLLGFTPDESRAYIAESGLGGQIICEGVKPRNEAIAAVRQADALLAVQVAFADRSKPVPYIPGKVYDYLATGSPILAPVPVGDLRDLLHKAPQAYLSDFWDPTQVADSMRRLARDIDADTVPQCDPQWLSQYSRIELTRQLATLFDQVLNDNRSVPSRITGSRRLVTPRRA